jgi:DNA-binding CsgD family transcriptional regulator
MSHVRHEIYESMMEPTVASTISISQKDRTQLVYGLSSFVALLVAVTTILDLISDLKEGITVSHMIFEAVTTTGSLFLSYWLLQLWRESRAESVRMTIDLETMRVRAEVWRKESALLRDGLIKSIDSQLESWKLTAAEREITFLLIKGLSLKEIAAVRGTSERTVRTQSLAIYAKSELDGRAGLSAFFLEDLLK